MLPLKTSQLDWGWQSGDESKHAVRPVEPKGGVGNPGLCHISDLKTGHHVALKEQGGVPREH